jgi:Recombinase
LINFHASFGCLDFDEIPSDHPPSTIKLILTNPHYVGDLVQNRSTTVSMTSKKRKKVESEKLIIVEKAHDAIITREAKYLMPFSNK